MAEQVLQATVTIPAHTPVAAPVTIALPFDDWDVEQIDLEVPDGPNGNMGFVLSLSGAPWIPRTPGEWLVWNDHKATFWPTGYPIAGGWAITGYNLGTYNHTVAARFHVNGSGPPPPPARPFVITFVQNGVAQREPVVL